MVLGLLGTLISTTSTIFGLFTGSKEPGEGFGGRGLDDVSIFAVSACFSGITTAPFSCICCSIS